MEELDAIIIGAGACGLMCATQAGFLGKKTIVLEKNSKPGSKILISGGGRCNFMNLYAEPQHFISQNPHFVKSALSQFSVDDTLNFFQTYGIVPQEKTLGQLFPSTNKAKDIVEIFEVLCKQMGQEIICEAEVNSVEKEENGQFMVVYTIGTKQKQLRASKLVIASGGLPVQKMGATDFGLKIARQFGLKIVNTAPALVPLTITGKDAEWYSALSGNSFFCRVWNDRISFEENILFTHWGLSGPAILQISSYWRAGESIFIDFFPSQDFQQLLETEKLRNGKKALKTFLSDHFSRKFADALIGNLQVDKNLASLHKQDIEKISILIHQFELKPAGDKGYDRAEVMRGGIDTQELSSRTLESIKVPGLYFGGECVDVTGWLGGYNFQWAWSSGYVMAQHL